MPKFPKCDFEGCDIPAKYGMPGLIPRRCDSHIIKGMMIFPETKCAVQVKDKDTGKMIPCGKQAIFGDRHKPKRCDTHKSAYTINHIVNNTCGNCGTVNLLTLRGTCINPHRCSQRVLRPIMEEKNRELEAKRQEEEKKRLEQEKDKPQPPAPKKYTYRKTAPVFPFSPVGPVKCGPQEPIQEPEEKKRNAKPRKFTKRAPYWAEKEKAKQRAKEEREALEKNEENSDINI